MGALIEHREMISTEYAPLRIEFSRYFTGCRAPKLRTIREFAEQEIILVNGPKAGLRYNVDYQPYSRLFFEEFDSNRWRSCYVIGPTQSGKTLTCFVIVLLYFLFERGETVVCGIPDMDMVGDKWNDDIRPVIEKTKYKKYLPRKGSGSRDGTAKAFRFLNGATLRFMLGGGSVKGAAGFTTRVVVFTEFNGLDEVKGNSKEGSKIDLILGRNRAYGTDSFSLAECTVDDPFGAITRYYEDGTASDIACPCPHCGEYFVYEKDAVQGWATAESKYDAKHKAQWVCCVIERGDDGETVIATKGCGKVITEEQRLWSNKHGIVVHRGQYVEVVDGTPVVMGDAPKTDSLGFRWNAYTNMFVPASVIGAELYGTLEAFDEDAALRVVNQQVFAIPHESVVDDLKHLTWMQVSKRMGHYPRGVVPPEAIFVTSALDLGKYRCHWCVIAWMPDGTPYVVDYGVISVYSREQGEELALGAALDEYADMCMAGWPIGRAESKDMYVPDKCGVDEGSWKPVVVEFIKRVSKIVKNTFYPIKGLGDSQAQERKYTAPKKRGGVIRSIGSGWHVVFDKVTRLRSVQANVDEWKTYLHQRILTPIGKVGALVFFASEEFGIHIQISKHLLSEKQESEYVNGKGMITKWVKVSKENHWLDSLVYACVMGSYCGVPLPGQVPKTGSSAPKVKRRAVKRG